MVFVAWAAAAVGGQERTASPPVAGVAIVIACSASILGVRRAVVDSRLIKDARRDAARLSDVARSHFTDAEAAAKNFVTSYRERFSDVAYWVAMALGCRCTAAELQQLTRNQVWWHDVRLRNDPSIVFDHVNVGAYGVLFVHDILATSGYPLTVDGTNGLSYAGYPIGGADTEHLMVWQLRAASTLARAIGLPMSAVTAIAVVDGAELVDAWGARTEVEQLHHDESGLRLTYCERSQLAAAVLTDCHLEADVAALAAHQLGESVVPDAVEVIHQPPVRRTIAVRRRQRCEFAEQEVHHG